MHSAKQDRLLTVLLAALGLTVFALTLAVTLHVPLLGDDYFYTSIAALSGKPFWQEHLSHYTIVNGRFTVHLLLTLFLKMPPLVWQIANAVLLSAIAVLSVSHLTERARRGRNLLAAGLGVLLILALDIDMSHQSVYWLTGSFNYVYPLALLFAFWLLLVQKESRARSVFLPVLAFLSAATTEQNGMMTIGIAVLYLLDKFFLKKEKSKAIEFVSAALALAGCLTVYLAPATFVRYGLETDASFLETVSENLPMLLHWFVAHRYTTHFFRFALFAVAVFLLSISRQTKHPCVMRLFAVAEIGATVIAHDLSVLLSPVFSPRVIIALSLILLLAAPGMVTALVYLSKKRAHGYLFPLTALILAIGSQVMMSASPVLGARTALCSSVCLFLFSASLLLYAWDGGSRFYRAAVLTVCGVMLLYSVPLYMHTVHGYSENHAIVQENEDAIEAYKAGETETLTLKKNKVEDCGWSMPYDSEYHLYYFKMYYSLPEQTQIVWIAP